MKNVITIVSKILIILIFLQIIYMPMAQASFWGEIFQAGDDFLKNGSSQGTAINSEQFKGEISNIYNLLFSLGVVLSVVIGAILGIKYMFGSIEEQAKIKETLIPYAIGCLVIFGAFGIWKLAINIFSSLN